MLKSEYSYSLLEVVKTIYIRLVVKIKSLGNSIIGPHNNIIVSISEPTTEAHL